MTALRIPLKNISFMCFFFLLISSVSMAQMQPEVKSGFTQHTELSAGNNSDYYYPAFKKGKVTFITGTANTGILNYNTQTGEIAYISSKKDTVVFDEMYLIDMITMDSDTFYYDTQQGSVLKLLKSINGRKLLVKESQVQNSAALPKTYYISHKSDYIPVTTSNVITLFAAHAAELQQYIKEHNYELKSEDEISKVLEYAANL
ncbi:hypothetical protein WG947_16645 [Pontibacter sp. H259]|uniref:hypothetical protein n=1 Tax=Pontibacter sp. H259 TaxID=3133421 RepID=UPI0030C3DDAA